MRLKCLLVLSAFVQCTYGTTTATTEKIEIFTPEYIRDSSQDLSLNLDTPLKSISDLVLQQTEAIKKIVSEQASTEKSANDEKSDTKSKETIENDSIEELKKKCQQLRRIFNSATANLPENFKDSTERTRIIEAFGPSLQPNFLKFKPKFPSPPPINMPQPPKMSGNYFIFTQNPGMYGPRINKYSDKMDTAASTIEEDAVAPPSEEVEYEYEEESVTTTITQTSELETTTPTAVSTTTVTVPTIPTKPKFKYVRLEPIILKKVLLPNGKSSLYWYRLFPTTQSFVQIPDTPETENVEVVAQPQNYNKDVSLPAQYQFYVDPQTGVIKPNTPVKPPVEISTTSSANTISATAPEKPTPRPQFFINPQTGMIYQSALPHQFIYHKRLPLAPPTTTTTTTTTTEKIPLPTYTVDIPLPEEKPAESKKQFKHEFRFVIPMVVSGLQEEVSNYPYQFDPYAYLPKGDRPKTMNMPVPYVPNYQMIRTLTIPNKLQELAGQKEA